LYYGIRSIIAHPKHLHGAVASAVDKVLFFAEQQRSKQVGSTTSERFVICSSDKLPQTTNNETTSFPCHNVNINIKQPVSDSRVVMDDSPEKKKKYSIPRGNYSVPLVTNAMIQPTRYFVN